MEQIAPPRVVSLDHMKVRLALLLKHRQSFSERVNALRATIEQAADTRRELAEHGRPEIVTDAHLKTVAEVIANGDAAIADFDVAIQQAESAILAASVGGAKN